MENAERRDYSSSSPSYSSSSSVHDGRQHIGRGQVLRRPESADTADGLQYRAGKEWPFSPSKAEAKKSKRYRKRTTLSRYHLPSMMVRYIPRLPIVLLRSWRASSPMTEFAWIRRRSTAFQTGSFGRTAHDAKIFIGSVRYLADDIYKVHILSLYPTRGQDCRWNRCRIFLSPSRPR